MSGNSLCVLDTNIILYHLGNKLQNPLEKRRYSISIITEIELLSYSQLSEAEDKAIRSFIEGTTVIELINSIKDETIKLRKQYGLKVPDAIIAATALRLKAPLITNDKKLLGVREIQTQSVAIRSS